MRIVEVSQIPTKDQIQDVPLDDPAKVYNVCLELQELCEKENGIGISAVQAGIPWKLFLVKGDGACPLVPKGKYGYFVNCDYEAVTREQVASLEGCLSLRSPEGRLRFFQVERSTIVRIFGLRLCVEGSLCFEPVDCALDFTQGGVVFQHEADHAFGHDRLISNIGKEVYVW